MLLLTNKNKPKQTLWHGTIKILNIYFRCSQMNFKLRRLNHSDFLIHCCLYIGLKRNLMTNVNLTLTDFLSFSTDTIDKTWLSYRSICIMPLHCLYSYVPTVFVESKKIVSNSSFYGVSYYFHFYALSFFFFNNSCLYYVSELSFLIFFHALAMNFDVYVL